MLVSPDGTAIHLDASETITVHAAEGRSLRKSILDAVHIMVRKGRHGDIELLSYTGALLALFAIDWRSNDDYSISIMKSAL